LKNGQQGRFNDNLSVGLGRRTIPDVVGRDYFSEQGDGKNSGLGVARRRERSSVADPSKGAIIMAEEKWSGPTVDQVLEEFLNEQEQRLSARTYRNYRNVIALLGQCIEDYATPPYDPVMAQALEEARQAGDEHALRRLSPPQQIIDELDHFLAWYMVRKVIAGQDFIKAAGVVARKLVRWMKQHDYIQDDDDRKAQDIKELGRSLPKATAMRNQLDRWVSRSKPSVGLEPIEEGHFEIVEITDGGWQIRATVGTVSGEVSVPATIRNQAEPGWRVSGRVAQMSQGLRWVEVWNVYPTPW